jgi:murein DD-endopeptidase MepM/ murein hydrolase activator NlpD
MTGITPSTSLRLLPALQNGENGAANASSPAGGDFQTLLTALVMSMSMPSTDGTGSLGQASPAASLFAPVMYTLMEKLIALQMQSVEAESQTAAAPQPVPAGMPIQGRLTQSSHAGHVALDLAAPVGTPVTSTMDGRVVYAGWNNQGYGNLVIVENGPYKTYYAHLSEIPVQVGQTVQAGQVIAYSGNTGNSTGPHLHYEVRVNGQRVDPSPYLQSWSPG